MATTILTPVVTHQPTHQHHLNEADRLTIIQQSPSSKKLREIERERLNFIGIYGQDGLEMSALNNENSL